MVDIKLEGREVAKSVVDLFSPLTEIAGAIGDNIRVYRKLSVLRTLKRAKEIVDKEGLILKTPPVKFLIPFLENSSLEEENDDLLNDLWARLLVSSSTDFKGEYNLFIRILNELSPDEAKAFNYIAKSSIHDSYEGYYLHLEDTAEDWSDSSTYIKIRNILAKYQTTNFLEIDYAEFEKKLKSMHQPPGTYIYFFCVTEGKEKQYPIEEVYSSPRCDFDDLFEPVSISMLISLGLIKDFRSPEYWFDNIAIEIYVYTLTPLGASFYNACMDNKE